MDFYILEILTYQFSFSHIFGMEKDIKMIFVSKWFLIPVEYINPNTIKSYKILQKLSPKHAAHGVAQSTYPNYRHGKACLSKQPPWRAAGDPRLARGRSRVQAPGPAGALRALFFSTLPPFLLPEVVSFAPSPPTPQKC